MIETTANRADYKGDGVTTVFPIPFLFIEGEKEDIVVSIVKADNTTAVLTDDYYIDETAKTVTYPGYPPGEEKAEKERPPVLAKGERLILTRHVPIDQTRDLGSVWPYDEIEAALDKLTLILQDLEGIQKSSLRLSPAANPAEYSAELPYPVDGEAIVWKNKRLTSMDLKRPFDEAVERARALASAAAQSFNDVKAQADRAADAARKAAASASNAGAAAQYVEDRKILGEVDGLVFRINPKDMGLDIYPSGSGVTGKEGILRIKT